MDTSNTTTASTIRTDYGSTTLKVSIENKPTANKGDTIEATSAAKTTHAFGYQSLPYSSSTNLYAKSRFSKMSIDVMPNSESRQLLERLEYFLNVFNQICIGFVTIYMSWLCLRTGLAGTGLHAWLATIGFSFLMAEAIMCHYNNNVVTTHYRRNTKTTIHWILQVLGGSLGMIGVLIKCIQKNFSLHSIHGKLGILTCIFLTTSLLTGISSLFANEMKLCMRPLFNKAMHNVWGLLTFTLAMISMFTAFETDIFLQHSLDANHYIDFKWLIQSCIIIIWLLSVYGPLWCLVYTKFWNM